MTRPLRLSVLDRSLVRRGHSAARSLRRTVEFAVQVEELGYHRFWVAEHHGVPGVAGAAPTVLAAAVASATSRIRVGTGGVMLPNHAPLVVAEQIGVLESLFPGRIDMGLGRSLGFTEAVRQALSSGRDAADRFGADVAELLGYFGGEPGGRDARGAGVRAVPAQGLRVPAFVLATGSGVDRAAELGLPLVVAAVRGDDAMVSAIARYRERFAASPWAARPYVVVSRSVAVAATTEAARRLLLPEAWSSASSRVHGVFPALAPVEDILSSPRTDREEEQLQRAMAGHMYGTDDEVRDALDALVDVTGADEVLVTTSGYDEAALLDSSRRLARLADLTTDANDARRADGEPGGP